MINAGAMPLWGVAAALDLEHGEKEHNLNGHTHLVWSFCLDELVCFEGGSKLIMAQVPWTTTALMKFKRVFCNSFPLYCIPLGWFLETLSAFFAFIIFTSCGCFHWEADAQWNSEVIPEVVSQTWIIFSTEE